MRIKLSEPDGPYTCTVDPGTMNVEIMEAFLGVGFITEDGERLSVAMRDSGFEVRYQAEGYDSGWMEFKEGHTNA